MDMERFLDEACCNYYRGEPTLSDEEFDFLSKKYKYESVGHKITDGVPHLFRMYSLQKVLVEEEIPDGDYIVSPKWDGAAVSLLYVHGKLVTALTRGDGIMGTEITEKVKDLVPNEIMTENLLQKQPSFVQICGEVVAPTKVSANPRNYASGALNLKDMEKWKDRKDNLYFVAYDIHGGSTQPSYTTYLSQMAWLETKNFRVCTNFADIGFPTDGEVWRLNNLSDFENAGYTNHHPRGAFALKEIPEGVVTTLEGVIWQTGKSGVVSPVGLLYPVDINGAIVARATLHNIDYIRSLDLEIGCEVEVIRAGEIIPRIVRRVDN